jgi:transposase
MVGSTPSLREITGGVDTHADTHTAAVLDELGRLLGHQQFPATSAGYDQLEAWLRSLGHVVAIGVEGTGSYGAGLFGHLRRNGLRIIEVDQ